MASTDPSRLLIRRELRSGRKLLHRQRSRFERKAVLPSTDLATEVDELTDEQPVVPKAVELQQQVETLTGSRVGLLRLIGRIAKLAGITKEM